MGKFPWYFVLLTSCSIYEYATTNSIASLSAKCYDNVIADFTLNNGNPTGIYGYVDLYEWNGWLKMLGLYIFVSIIK